MKLKKISWLLAALCISVLPSFAQKQTLQGIQRFHPSSLTPIYEKTEVKGYMFFYRADKADKKNDNYIMDVFDHELNKVKSIVMQKQRKSYILLRNSYNGSAFSFYFYNYRTRELELETYDKGLNKLATHKISEMSKIDKIYIQQEMEKGKTSDNNILGGMNLYPVPEKGFVRNSYEGLGKTFELEMYDNNLKLKWRFLPERGKDYESVGITEVTDKYILATIIRRPTLFSKRIDSFVAAFDVETGKKVMDMPIETEGPEQLSLSTVSYDEQRNEFLVLGEFYNEDDKPFVNKSQGFFVKRFGPDGKKISSRLYGWNKEVKSLMPSEATKSLEENFINYIHKIVKDDRGNMYVVAEQYKIMVSGVGIAAKAMGGKVSTMKGKIGNLLIFAVDSKDDLKEITFYPKEETDVFLPDGSGWHGAGLLGHLIKMDQGFDYQFTQLSNDASEFSIAYLNFDKKGKGTKTSLVNVMKDKAGSYNTDNIDITSGRRGRSLTYPAKNGYNMILDYSEEEKAMEMKLVKLNR